MSDSTDMVAVPRWVFADFLNNQPGWTDLPKWEVPPAASVSPGMETLQASECTKHGEGDQ